MRTFNFTFLALFGCIAMIGATPLRAKAVGRRDVLYVAHQSNLKVLTRLINLPSAQTALSFPTPTSAWPALKILT